MLTKKKRKKPIQHESLIQQEFFKRVRSRNDPRVRFVHSSQTAGARSIPARVRAKAEGMLPGVADVSAPIPNDEFHGLYLEFKHGNRPQRPEQKEFEQYCDKYNYQYHVVRSADEAIERLDKYLETAHL